MKAFYCIVLAAVLSVQFTDALPRPRRSLRIRRGTLRIPRAATSDESDNMTEHDKIMLFGINELSEFGENTVESFRQLFDKVVQQAEKSNLNLNSELRELRDFSKATDELDEYTGEEHLDKVFDLFGKSTDITDKYDLDEVNNPTDAQKTMARLLEENGLMLLHLQFLGRIGRMREHFTERFQTYVDSLTPAEKRKERKFVQWFNKFKRERDFEKNIEIMFQFFDFLE